MKYIDCLHPIYRFTEQQELSKRRSSSEQSSIPAADEVVAELFEQMLTTHSDTTTGDELSTTGRDSSITEVLSMCASVTCDDARDVANTHEYDERYMMSDSPRCEDDDDDTAVAAADDDDDDGPRIRRSGTDKHAYLILESESHTSVGPGSSVPIYLQLLDDTQGSSGDHVTGVSDVQTTTHDEHGYLIVEGDANCIRQTQSSSPVYLQLINDAPLEGGEEMEYDVPEQTPTKYYEINDNMFPTTTQTYQKSNYPLKREHLTKTASIHSEAGYGVVEGVAGGSVRNSRHAYTLLTSTSYTTSFEDERIGTNCHDEHGYLILEPQTMHAVTPPLSTPVYMTRLADIRLEGREEKSYDVPTLTAVDEDDILIIPHSSPHRYTDSIPNTGLSAVSRMKGYGEISELAESADHHNSPVDQYGYLILKHDERFKLQHELHTPVYLELQI